MTHIFFERHLALLESAVIASSKRGYWSPYSDIPSQRIYGENANTDGKSAFDNYLDKYFELNQNGIVGQTGNEISPFGISLGIRYPKIEIESLFSSVNVATLNWRKASPEIWVGIALEILSRLNKHSFEIAYSVMHTTGQAFTMAFQAGGPHAQDRGLEAVAYAWSEMQRTPKEAYWEKPQGKNNPLKMHKTYNLVPRGIGLVIGCCTFPTWNSYPGIFANLSTGNAVIVKPHPTAILPLAITVRIAREVIAEAGFDPNIINLFAHETDDPIPASLALRPEIKLIDFTGSSLNGNWIERHAIQAKVFTEKSGINQIIIDSTNDFKGMIRNIAFSLSLYSGQMCTAPQNIYIPKDGINTSEGHMSFDQIVIALDDAIKLLVADSVKSIDILGAIQSKETINRINEAKLLGEIITDSQQIHHPEFPDARIYTPLLIKIKDQILSHITHEFFGPISFIVPTDNTACSISIAKRIVNENGALTLSCYSTNTTVKAQLQEMANDSGVALSLNLTGGVFVNQSAAFSDYHGTGSNPAANSTLTDSAFVSTRFRIVQSREPI